MVDGVRSEWSLIASMRGMSRSADAPGVCATSTTHRKFEDQWQSRIKDIDAAHTTTTTTGRPKAPEHSPTLGNGLKDAAGGRTDGQLVIDIRLHPEGGTEPFVSSCAVNEQASKRAKETTLPFLAVGRGL
jgi:hypothetical protein